MIQTQLVKPMPKPAKKIPAPEGETRKGVQNPRGVPDRKVGADRRVGPKRRVGPYRIEEQIGAGGMGVVYRAMDVRLERPVALKFLPAGLGHQGDVNQRFLQEARAASALDHPNICTIYDLGRTEEGRPYIAMALYQGETLKDRLLRGPLEAEDVAEIARQVAEGLAESHARDIVHRDIKPANLWLTDSGRVKILDFGLAKVAGEAGLTRTGDSMGTPTYMSPEQIRGEGVDHRTDLWSLGVVLYEALTGRVPFSGSNVPAILYAIHGQDPLPVRQLRQDVPEGLVVIVGRLLEKALDQRYSSGEQLLEDLGPLTGRPSRPRNSLSGIRPPAEAETSPKVSETPTHGSGSATQMAKADAAKPATPILGTRPKVAVEEKASPRPKVSPPATRPADAPEPFEQYLNQGLEAALARDYRHAAEAFEKALALRPDDSRAQFNLARVQQRLVGRSG